MLAYLGGQFGAKIIAMDSIEEQDWPARSPDLIPFDFFVKGYNKYKGLKPAWTSRPGAISSNAGGIEKEKMHSVKSV